jgi:MFS superfamily sulfate permease-like transporter
MSQSTLTEMSEPLTAAELLPKDRIPGLLQNWKTDLMSGFILSLIALPLSLGIAIASGAPPMAGLFAAIVGGIVVSQSSGSFVTINGPAAGLIVVIVNSVERLGGGAVGYHCTLAAVVISGIALLGLGLCRAGMLGNLFPATVVHGMLAAIGFIIIAKEIPPFLGVKAPSKEPLQIFAAVPNMVANMNPEIATIGFVSLAILIAFIFLNKNPIIKKIPAPIVVVLAGIAMGNYYDLQHAHSYLVHGHSFDIDPKKYLVILPPSILDGLTTPDWSKIASGAFWYSAVTIILIQGIETLLSCAAVDKLDPYKRKSDLSRDVAAVGAGTAISGMIGGLPMIAEIVRSTANVANGARTRWSNTFHGMFILLFVAFGAAYIDLIPQSALAALLIITGYRLASPRSFIDNYKLGVEQLALFVITIIAVLATDLLTGVGVGIACKLVIHIVNGAPIGPNLFVVDAKTEGTGNTTTITLKGAAIFLNYISLKRLIDKAPSGNNVVVDMSQVKLIDHSVMEHLHETEKDFKKAGREFHISGLENHKPMSNHPLAARKLARAS